MMMTILIFNMAIPQYIIGIDVGAKGGIAVFDTCKDCWIQLDSPSFANKKNNKLLIEYRKGVFSNKTKPLINAEEIYDYFFDLFLGKSSNAVAVIGEAFGQARVVKKHSKFYGIIEMVCAELQIRLSYVTDNSARLVVLGKGNGKRKDLVHEKYKADTPDISDAMLFVDWFIATYNKTT